MRDMIRVEPRSSSRLAFARWAVAQIPKVRTVSPQAFSVPPDLFVTAPENILIGALIDGHRYVSPEEDRAAGRERPTALKGQLLGVARPEAFTPPPAPKQLQNVRPAPEPVEPVLPQPMDRLDAAPPTTSDPVATDTAPAAVDGDVRAELHPCDLCPRTFGTARGRDNHRRQRHQTSDWEA